MEILEVARALFWSVLCCSVVTVALALERFLVLARRGIDVPQTLARLRTVIRKGEPGELLAFAGEKDSPVPSMLRRFAQQWAREGVPAPALLQRAGTEEVSRLELRLSALAAFAVITPTVGSLALVLAVLSSLHAGFISLDELRLPLLAALLGMVTGAVAHLSYTLALRRVRRLAARLDETGRGLLGLLQALPVTIPGPGARSAAGPGDEDEFFRPRG